MPPRPKDPVFQRPGSKFWHIRYTDHHHREVRLSSRTEVYEEAWSLYEALKSGNGLTLTAIAERFFEEHEIKPKTRECYKSNLRAWVSVIGDPRVEFIDRGVIQKFVATRLPLVRHGTIRGDLAFMSSLLLFATQLPGGPETNAVTTFNKRHLKKAEERVRFLRPDQVTKLLGALTCDTHRLVVLFGLEAGLRRSEILNLRLFQVNLWKRRITLQSADTKTASGRVVPMSRTLIRACAKHLRTYPDLRTDQGSHLILNPKTGRPFTDTRPWYDEAVEKTGLQDFTFHDTRHHFASTYVQRGGRLQALSELLGHTTITMTARYAYLSPGHAQEEFHKVMRGIR